MKELSDFYEKSISGRTIVGALACAVGAYIFYQQGIDIIEITRSYVSALVSSAPVLPRFLKELNIFQEQIGRALA